jgi:serine/threonine-protein kinase
MNDTIGKFEIKGPLGQGAMGEVFLGLDPVIGREVAIKTLSPGWIRTPQARERFFREAQAAGQLNHPNIVTILEFGEDRGRLYLVMEYVAGQDLSTAMAERSLAPPVLLELLAQVCDGLAAAHRKGILHRDIKPSNIRLTADPGDRRAKILDFGIARIHSSELTTSSTLLGTFNYMAPEYIETGQPGCQADLFAVGVMLYEGLAGRRPFRGDTTATLLYNIVHETPKPPPAAHLRGISRATLALLERAMAKDPGQRFESAEALAAQLRAARDPAWTGPRPPADAGVLLRAAPLVRHPGRRRAMALAALALLILSGFLLGRKARPGSPLPAPGPIPLQVAAARAAPAPAAVPVPVAAPAPAAVPQVAVPTPQPKPEPPPPAAAQAPAERPGPAGPPGSVDSFQAAVASLDSDPAAALDYLEQHPQTGARQERATALTMVAMYRLGRFGDCDRLLRATRQQGVPIARLALAFPRFAQMLAQDRREHHLQLTDTRVP